jgi:hypothetical protein
VTNEGLRGIGKLQEMRRQDSSHGNKEFRKKRCRKRAKKQDLSLFVFLNLRANV